MHSSQTIILALFLTWNLSVLCYQCECSHWKQNKTTPHTKAAYSRSMAYSIAQTETQNRIFRRVLYFCYVTQPNTVCDLLFIQSLP